MAAFAVNPPTVDTPLSPVDANVATITGTASPGARINTVGGPYDIGPVYADSTGHFEVTVALSQETSNLFFLAVQEGSEQSENVTVQIIEGTTATQSYELEYSVDRTAPSAPTLDSQTVVTNESTFVITGEGETDAKIIINDVDSKETVDVNGNFEVTVNLTGNNTQDTFTIRLKDSGGNLSTGAQVKITSSADVTEDETPIPTLYEEELPDIDGHWGEEYIMELYEEGVVSGYQDGTFGPDNPVLRSEILKIALEAFNDDLTVEGEFKAFSDVQSDDWFFNYVHFGYKGGTVEGYDDGTYRPGENVNRAAALKIILESAGITEFGDPTDSFDDVDATDWYAKYVTFAVENGIVSGYSDGLFHGERNMTRAEVCKIVSLVMDYMAGL